MEKLDCVSNSGASSVLWINLPVEIWVAIFGNLSQTTLLFIIRNVCRFFREIIFDPMLWKCIDMNEWVLPSSSSIVFVDCDDTYDVNCLLDVLSRGSHIQSTNLFTPVVDKVHHVLTSLTFSRYEGDFELGTQQLMILCKCSNLQYLNTAFCNEINAEALSSICSHCSKLRTVILEGCSGVTDDAVKELNKLCNLEILNISHCAAVTDEGLNHIMLMQARLKEFYCDGVLRTTDFALLPFAQYQNGIRMLSLDGEHLHDISLVSLLVNLANLNSLRVSFCNNLTDITLSALLRCADHRFKELHLKNLSDNLSSAVLTQLFGQMNMSYLHHLTLTDCLPVHDSTVRAISINCLLLEDVRLDWCTSITDDGISALVNGCRQLKKLYLVGLKMLHGSWLPGLELIQPKLSYLDLSQCDLIVDEELLGFVMRKPDVTAFNYYHEEVTNMDKRPNTPAPQPLPPSSVDPPCPASQGAFVDF